MQRHLTFEGGYNIRDLGGYPTQDGRQTRFNILIRSGGLDKTSPAGQEQLIAHGIRTIIDLRDDWEIKKYGHPFTDSQRVTYLNLPLIGDALTADESWTDETSDLTEMHEFYTRYLARCQPQIGKIITAMVDRESPTLFHCYAGKDRTGIIAALILMAMNVSEETIIEDYAVSEVQLADIIAQRCAAIEAQGGDVTRMMARVKKNFASQPQTMMITLATLKEQYGSAVEYLAQCGVTAAQLETLKARFLE
jgi:protein-tyrosine phosphatase